MFENSSLYEEVSVSGHTDVVPINTAAFASNWELSSARATTVIKYLAVDAGLDPEALDMSATGYSQYQPVDSSTPADPDAQEAVYAKNRRIEMAIAYDCKQ